VGTWRCNWRLDSMDLKVSGVFLPSIKVKLKGTLEAKLGDSGIRPLRGQGGLF
jgi:hypothetical protein